MIGNNVLDRTIAGIISLQEAPFLIFPCGSRFFGDATESSDFDFFVESSADLWDWLERVGGLWKRRGLPEYHDVNAVCIYSTSKKKLDKGVHLIVVKSADARLEAQTHAKKLSKKERKTVAAWDDIYSKLAPELFE